MIVLSGNSDSLILYLYPQKGSHPKRPDRDHSPGRAVFDSIVQKIEQRLTEPFPVMADHEILYIVSCIHLDLNILLLCIDPDPVDRLQDGVKYPARLRLQPDHARLHPGNIDQRADQLFQTVQLMFQTSFEFPALLKNIIQDIHTFNTIALSRQRTASGNSLAITATSE